jgi:hypothetical protein
MMRMMISGAAALTLALAAGSAMARTQDAAQDLRDIQCIALVSMAAADAPAEQQAGLVGGMMYYLGRLEGRDPTTDWLDRIADFLRTPGVEQQLLAERQRCGQELVAKGQTMMEWGAGLKAEMEAKGD